MIPEFDDNLGAWFVVTDDLIRYDFETEELAVSFVAQLLRGDDSSASPKEMSMAQVGASVELSKNVGWMAVCAA